MAIEQFLTSSYFVVLIVIISIWEMVWKGLGCWKAGNKKDKYWFIAIFVLNTAGILPIIYLYLKRKNKGKK